MDTDPIAEYERVVDHIYGVYLDATTGFWHLRVSLDEGQKQTIDMLNATNRSVSMEDLDLAAWIYGKGNPNEPGSKVLHRCTQKELRERNGKRGINYKFIANMALVSMYQYWEDYYRARIAERNRCGKNDLRNPIMGDLRILRNSIIHHSGVAHPKVARCQVLKWFKPSDDIFIDNDQFEEIIVQIKSMLNELRQTHVDKSA